MPEGQRIAGTRKICIKARCPRSSLRRIPDMSPQEERKFARIRSFTRFLVLPRDIDPSRTPSAEVPEPRSSRLSIMPMSAPGTSLMTGSSLLPSASLHVYSVLLSAVAGYVDAAGFASLIGLFPAHLTGELVGDAIALSSGRSLDHPAHLWVLPVFVGAVVAAAFVARLLRRRGRKPLAGLLALVTLALALFSFSDFFAQLFHAPHRISVLMSAGCAVAAMGFQNALMRESLITSCPTTVMTGNLTLVVIDLADRLLAKILRPSPLDRRARSRLGPVSLALGAFLLFAMIGGFLTRVCGSASVILPTLVTAFLAAWAWRQDRSHQATKRTVIGLGAARLPTFEASPTVGIDPRASWPKSLVPQAPTAVVSVCQLPSAQALPPPPLDVASVNSRGTGEKRTISGTQLAQRFRLDQETESEPKRDAGNGS